MRKLVHFTHGRAPIVKEWIPFTDLITEVCEQLETPDVGTISIIIEQGCELSKFEWK